MENPKGITIVAPFTVGNEVFVVHGGKLKGVKVDRIDILVTGPDQIHIKYKLEGIKKLYKEVFATEGEAALASYGKL